MTAFGHELRSLTLRAGTAMWIDDIDRALDGAMVFAETFPRRTVDYHDRRRATSYRWSPARRLVVTPLTIVQPLRIRPIRLLGIPRERVKDAGRLAFRLVTEGRRSPHGIRKGITDGDLVAWWTRGRTAVVTKRWTPPEGVSERWTG